MVTLESADGSRFSSAENYLMDWLRRNNKVGQQSQYTASKFTDPRTGMVTYGVHPAADSAATLEGKEVAPAAPETTAEPAAAKELS